MPAVDLSSSMRRLTAGDELGRWVIDHCVSPGLPRLYQACRRDDREARALVTTLPKETRWIDQLRREASMLRTLSHPAVPELIDFGLSREHSLVWMATADVSGQSLQDRLLTGAIPWHEACGLFQQLAAGLRHVHEHSIVHRDVHPAKILLPGDGRACLVGFESAMNEGELAQAADIPLGPLGYLAPEVITEGRPAGPRSDLYALGVVFFEALAGRSAFPAALMDERVDPRDRMLDWKTRSEPLRPPDVPDWLANLVEKATHPDPAERLPDLDAFVGWLEAARGLWEPDPEPEPEIAQAPPPLQMARPSLAPAQDRVTGPVAGAARPEGMLPMAYMTAAALGVTLGVLVSVLVILAVELPGA